MSTSEPVCIGCGLPIGSPPRLNHRPTGEACSTCMNRLLECLPAALPTRGGEVSATAEEISHQDQSSGDARRPKGPHRDVSGSE